MLDKNLFSQMFTMLCEPYGKQQTKALMSIYYMVLQEMEDDEFKYAVMDILKTRKSTFFPTPGEIYEYKRKDPVLAEDDTTKEAKRLIDIARAMNESVYQEHIKTGVPFSDLLEVANFVSVSKDDIAIMDQVKPYYSYKTLIANINHYQTTLDALNAFKDAILFSPGNSIENKSINRLRIKK